MFFIFSNRSPCLYGPTCWLLVRETGLGRVAKKIPVFVERKDRGADQVGTVGSGHDAHQWSLAERPKILEGGGDCRGTRELSNIKVHILVIVLWTFVECNEAKFAIEILFYLCVGGLNFVQ